MKSKRIVLVPNFISTMVNGEIFLRNTEIRIFKELVAFDFEVNVYGNVSNADNQLLKSKLTPESDLHFKVALKSWKWFHRVLTPFLFLYKFIKLSFGKDLMYVYLPFNYAVFLFPFLLFKRNYAIYVRGHVFEANKFSLFVYRYLIRNSKFNLCTGKYLTGECIKLNPNTYEVVQMLSINYKDEINKIFHPERINFLYLSGISKDKGVFDLLSIGNRIIEDLPQVYITIVGSGPAGEMSEFNSLYEGIVDKERIKYLGRVEHSEEIEEIFNAHDYFIHTSYKEGFPRAILEAMMHDLVVLSSDILAVRHFLLHNDNSLLFEKGNPESLYQLIKNVTIGKLNVQQIRENARALVATKLEYYQKEVSHASQIVKYYQNCIVNSNDFLILHNYLWSHYKAAVFSNLQEICDLTQEQLFVIQMAYSENQRVGMGDADLKLHQYRYSVLFDGALDSVSFVKRFISLHRTIKRIKYKVINIPGYSDLAVVAIMFIQKLLGRNIVMSFDSTYLDKSRSKILEFMKSMILKVPNGFMCYGNKQKDYLMHLGVPEKKIHFRRQATNNEIIRQIYLSGENTRQNKQKKQLLYVGRINDEHKNIFKLVKLFAEINNPEWQLVLVGNGKDKDELLKLIISLNVDAVYQHGLDWRAIVEFYKKSDLFILPSLSEPWGLVVNEAMLCELPVLVSNHCGSSQHLVENGANGFTFDPKSDEDMKEKMKTMMLSDNLIEMGKRSLEIISEYTPERSAKEMYDIFKNYIK